VPLDDRLHPLEVAGEEAAKRLGIDRLAERCRPGDVAEEDGDRLAYTPSSLDRERRAAGTAEAEAVRILLSAASLSIRQRAMDLTGQPSDLWPELRQLLVAYERDW
jgi:hypothetical protein